MKKTNRKAQEKAEQKQQEMMKPAEPPPTPRIVDGKLSAEFVKFSARRDSQGESYLHLVIAHELDSDSVKRFDKMIGRTYREILDHECDAVDLTLKHQTVTIRSTPEEDPPALHIITKLEAVRLEIIESKGTGQAKDGVRVTFKLAVKDEPAIQTWCHHSYAYPVWLTMERTQADLIPDDEEDAEKD